MSDNFQKWYNWHFQPKEPAEYAQRIAYREKHLKAFNAAQADARALVGELVYVLSKAKQPQGGGYGQHWLESKEAALTKAQEFMEAQHG